MQIYPTKLLNNVKGVNFYFSTKKDGNIAFHVGDDKTTVINRHKKLAKKLDFNYKSLIHMQQIHSNKVHIIEDVDDFSHPPICDAIITNKLNKPLMVMVADCSPILMYDRQKKVIAAIHAGRAGAFKNIIQKTINSFVNNFHSNPVDIIAIGGASIHECCYEVGEEIYEEAKQLHLEYALTQDNHSYYLNIPKILKRQLISSGVKEECIEFSDACSSCENHKYYSYRKEGQTGRFCALIILRE